MRIIIAPDSFKGSLTSEDVANHIQKVISNYFPQSKILKIPIADGGEGTVEVLTTYLGGEKIYTQVHGPLGKNIVACYGYIKSTSTAIIEMATASGLPLLTEKERNPLLTNTFGTGQLIKDALERQCKKIIICIGGSATNDGGAGMLQALGVEFFNKNGLLKIINGGNLGEIEKISIEKIDKRIFNANIIVACDVNNPLLGAQGASKVYGPQKGAGPGQVDILEESLEHFANITAILLKKDFRNVEGAGAAGGLGFGLISYLNANLQKGIDLVMETLDFENELKKFKPDLVITGEGMMDYQTAFGKAPFGVAKISKKYNIPVLAFCGALGKDFQKLYSQGFDSIFSIVDGPMVLDDALINAGVLLENAVERVFLLHARQLFK